MEPGKPELHNEQELTPSLKGQLVEAINTQDDLAVLSALGAIDSYINSSVAPWFDDQAPAGQQFAREVRTFLRDTKTGSASMVVPLHGGYNRVIIFFENGELDISPSDRNSTPEFKKKWDELT